MKPASEATACASRTKREKLKSQRRLRPVANSDHDYCSLTPAKRESHQQKVMSDFESTSPVVIIGVVGGQLYLVSGQWLVVSGQLLVAACRGELFGGCQSSFGEHF